MKKLQVISSLVAMALLAASGVASALDTDGDGVEDGTDNCMATANASQLDADGDGYGNICDADLNGSGFVTAHDYAMLRSVLGQAAGSSPTAAKSDLNGSLLVTAVDYTLLRVKIGFPPGPSGYACAGTIPCP